MRDNPITRIAPEGSRADDGTVHELDVIILATGFDAGTGALTRIDIRGRGGRSLTQDWGRDIRTTMGLMVHGYPNMLTTAVPLAPSAALCNMTTCLQQQTEWISDCDPPPARPGQDGDRADEGRRGRLGGSPRRDRRRQPDLPRRRRGSSARTFAGRAPTGAVPTPGGVGAYRDKCGATAAADYEGFEIH